METSDVSPGTATPIAAGKPQTRSQQQPSRHTSPRLQANSLPATELPPRVARGGYAAADVSFAWAAEDSRSVEPGPEPRPDRSQAGHLGGADPPPPTGRAVAFWPTRPVNKGPTVGKATRYRPHPPAEGPHRQRASSQPVGWMTNTAMASKLAIRGTTVGTGEARG